MYTSPYVKQTASGKLLCGHRESNPALCGNLEWWDGVGGGGRWGKGTYVRVADSLCVAEASAVL